MRRRQLRLFLLITSIFLATFACTTGPEKAKGELAKMGIAFTEDAFVQKAWQGDVAAVSLFLQAGMDPNAIDQKGNTALLLAAKEGHTAVAKLLLENGADIEAVDYNFGGTPLILAARSKSRI